MLRRSLGDFSTDGRQLAFLSLIAAVIGLMGGFIAWILLRLIALITHLAYEGRVGWSLVAPNTHHLGLWSVAIPVIGGLIVGLLARYGTDKIRGHGIPEAIQAILEENSQMHPRVALIKPIASAITIGTGGPFGAEGPIIMTGGAVGSLVAQFFSLSSLERRTLLVAGAAAGMSATFGAPVSAVLLAVELLLFEWRPRSLIPVAIASAIAEGVRAWLFGTAPIFATPTTPGLPWSTIGWAVGIGLAAGLLSGLLTKLVYFTEDAYHTLPIHWMWWPALGGLMIGIGGLLDQRALGVGYPTIRLLDAGHLVFAAALALLVVKAAIWVLSLSSGTSGGVLAPLLMLGGALGVVLSPLLPGHMAGIWATIGMAAMLGGTMRAPFTATIFTMETTHNWALLLPVLMASVAGMAVTVLWIPRSILTEKVARRGIHVAREYAVHPLEGQAVQNIMVPRDQVVGVELKAWLASVARDIGAAVLPSHRSYPVLDAKGEICGVVYRKHILLYPSSQVKDVTEPCLTVGDWERVRAVVEAMARENRGEARVVDRQGQWVGWVTRSDLFITWCRQIDQEENREQIFRRPWQRTTPQDDPVSGQGPAPTS